jgi:2-keto-3-deoxy-6-phosphogluconate aldolase
MLAADCPVFVGVGGGLTKGERVINLARHAEYQGATGVVLNAPTSHDSIREVSRVVDLPIVITVVKEEDIQARLDAGAQILNVSAAAKTPELVAKIREQFPDVPIMATGGPTEETIKATINAGADAITWTPPTNGEVFRDIMEAYRKGEPHP